MHALSPLTVDYAQMLNERKPKNTMNKSKLPFQIFTGETYNTMIYAIQQLLDNEGHTERVRIKLAERPHFSIPNIFQTIINISVRNEEERQRMMLQDLDT